MKADLPQKRGRKGQLRKHKDLQQAGNSFSGAQDEEDSGKQLAVVAETGLASVPLKNGGPYPTYARPLPQECWEVRDRLAELHGSIERDDCVVAGPAIEDTAAVVAHPVMALEWEQQGLTPTCLTEGGEEAKVALEDVGVHRKSKRTGRRNKEVKEEEADSPLAPPGAADYSGKELAVPQKLEETQPEWLVEHRCVLDALVATMLSQNTTDITANRAFAELKRQFPTWEEVLGADVKEVEAAVKCAGLAEVKVARMRHILATLQEERGEVSLEYLWSLDTEAVKAELSRFKGVGPKTVACVLMFHLQRDEFPVDTHVWHIGKMIGWVPANADRQKTYLHLNARVPEEIKFSLHCLLVEHGKRCNRCSKRVGAQRPDAMTCPLVNWNRKLKLLQD